MTTHLAGPTPSVGPRTRGLAVGPFPRRRGAWSVRRQRRHDPRPAPAPRDDGYLDRPFEDVVLTTFTAMWRR